MPIMNPVADWLHRFLDRHGASSGTVHVVDGDALHLTAAVNIPQKVQDVTRVIPRGRGMAGLAWERGKPVSTCNLKEDTTGDVRPGAKAVDAMTAVVSGRRADPRRRRYRLARGARARRRRVGRRDGCRRRSGRSVRRPEQSG